MIRERYQSLLQSDNMAAGLAGGATIASMRWTSTTHMHILKELSIVSITNTTAFTAGNAEIMLLRATGFTASDSGQASAGKGKMRTSFTASRIGADDLQIAQTAAVTAGTRTSGGLIGGYYFEVATVEVNKQLLVGPGAVLYKADEGDSDDGMWAAQNEGWYVTATVPATGVWRFALRCKWEERPGTA